MNSSHGNTDLVNHSTNQKPIQGLKRSHVLFCFVHQTTIILLKVEVVRKVRPKWSNKIIKKYNISKPIK